jgi:hypothetical protein
MAIITCSRATMVDAAEFAPKLRAEDMAELQMLGEDDALHVLENCLRLSGREAWTVRANGAIMSIWGVMQTSLVTGHAVVWALTSDLVNKYPKAFLRCSRQAVRELRLRYNEVSNHVDIRYLKSLRWVKKIGFAIESPSPYGLGTFHKITLRGV